MKIGFDTIGNATVIVYDGQPVLATDPWVLGSAYFGSWRTSHRIPEEQLDSVKNCRFIWFSHGHPDHLNSDSLHLFKGKKILLPDHAGGRIRDDLRKEGYDVEVLANRQWVRLSEHIRLLCISDYYQDAILLIDVNGRLIVDTNDAIDRGWGRFARNIVRQFPVSVLLALFGHGDADMINFYDEEGNNIPPKAARKLPVGTTIKQAAESWGVKYCIPFSSMHQYQRTDSIWANEYITHLDDYAKGFQSKTTELLPAYIQFDCETDTWSEINPPTAEQVIYEPEHFGDNWNDVLTTEDMKQVTEYFQRIQHLETFLDFINVRVGGQDNVIPLGKKKFNRGITFEVPRNSLLIATQYQVFDDLLIGNFMKTTLLGKWPKSQLYPDFTPYVARYSDNASSRTKKELDDYFEEYRKREPVEYVRHRFEQKSVDVFRSHVTGGSKLFQLGKRLYWFMKK
ncbi:MAG TPA: hypothetical protein VJ023_13295 [Pyrinomonadaceae bacterium]|nr:hypothetical protein [Pyrinomonadaceae bacterium]